MEKGKEANEIHLSAKTKAEALAMIMQTAHS